MPDDVVPSHTLRLGLGRFLREVHSGKTLTITVSGIPVATLAPYTTNASGTTVSGDVQMDVVDASAPTHRRTGVPLKVQNAVDDGDEPF